MDVFDVKATPRTPSVRLDRAQGVLEIRGVSLPDNTPEFFNPLMCKIDEYISSSLRHIKVYLHLEYLNTSSSKMLLDIFKKLSALDSVEFHWFYNADDEEMLEYGRNYEMLLCRPFKYYDSLGKN